MDGLRRRSFVSPCFRIVCGSWVRGYGSVRSLAFFALPRWLIVQILWLFLAPLAALAAPVAPDSRLCLGETPAAAGDDAVDRIAFTCGATPKGYQQASLWIRLDPRQYRTGDGTVTLLVHHTRFDRLAVAFRYADGSVEWQQVQSGAFGEHWRPGAQIAFTPEQRRSDVTAILLRFDRLASYSLLRMRLVAEGQAEIETGVLAALIGAALILLLAGALYNLPLALGVRRQYLAWQGAWAITVFLWGTVWSQFGLLVAPGIAGTLSSQVCTALSAFSILLATFSVTAALAPGMVPRPLRWTAILFGVAVALIGIPATFARGSLVDTVVPLLAFAVLGTLLAALLCLVWGVRRGSGEARDLLAAWCVPMAAVALTQFVNVGSALWGGGAQILVLFASAWQTLWLSIAASRRLALLRTERDLARAAEARASELAERDPLTGIRNRRGFVEAAQVLIETCARDAAPLALLLIDIDRFKAINDEFGHDIGDMVLSTLATRLARWEGPLCVVARLGGEEFALMVAHLAGPALARFSEHVRQELAACPHGAPIGDRSVTVSIGVAETVGGCEFARLYREADGALYAAKRSGRDRVCRAGHAADASEPQSGPRPAPLSASGSSAPRG